jgi:hypothetical protein
MHINNDVNNAVIMILFEGSKTLFCFPKFPWARERSASKFIDNLGMRH